MKKITLSGNILLNERGEIYLLFRKKHAHYEIPGGKVEVKNPVKKDLETEALRELKEEIKGIKKINSIKYLSKVKFTIPDGRRAISHGFITLVSGNLTPNEDIFDNKKSGWIKISKLKNINMSPNLKLFLPKIKKIKYAELQNANMKRAVLVHCWGGSPRKDWMPYAKNILEKKGYKVIAKKMPNTDEPKIKAWVNELNKINIEEKTLLIGHSIGCQTIIRYLSQKNKKAGNVILVAPWLRLKQAAYEDETSEKIAKPWIKTKINWEKTKISAKKFTCIFSTNDPFVYAEDSKKFKKYLNAKIIIKKNKGHFSKEEGVTKIPEVLKEI